MILRAVDYMLHPGILHCEDHICALRVVGGFWLKSHFPQLEVALSLPLEMLNLLDAPFLCCVVDHTYRAFYVAVLFRFEKSMVVENMLVLRLCNDHKNAGDQERARFVSIVGWAKGKKTFTKSERTSAFIPLTGVIHTSTGVAQVR